MQTLEHREGVRTWVGPQKTASPSLKSRVNNGKGIENKKRIVLVSPFSTFNCMFEYTLEQLTKDKKAELDLVYVADLPSEPFLNVAEREKKKESIPNCIIDFRLLGIRDGNEYRLERFNGYLEWVAETVRTMKDVRTRCLVPHTDSNAVLNSRIAGYALGEKFDPYSFKVSDLNEALKSDLAGIIAGSDDGFHLFGEIVADPSKIN